MRAIVDSIASEYRRYKALAEAAIAQVGDDELSTPGPHGENSIVAICWHMSGNFQSRFTEFLTTDGEKPWRHREEEFEARTVTRDELLATWEQGWAVVLGALEALDDRQLGKTVTIRGQALKVHEALHRSLAHTAYHVGQIVLTARQFRGAAWQFLSIPPGGSDAYNRNPRFEKAVGHTDALRSR